MVEELKKLVIQKVVEQAMKWAISKAAWLGWGPIGWLVSTLLTRLLTFLADKTILGATFVYIDLTVDKNVDKVEEVLAKIENAKKAGISDDDKKKLDDELADAGKDLIKFGTIR